MGTQLRLMLMQAQASKWLFWDRRKGGAPFAACASALLVFCGLKATVHILVQWVQCALREGRACARADTAENTAAGQDLCSWWRGELHISELAKLVNSFSDCTS